MKLVQQKEKFYVVCHTEDCGYESKDTYVFPSMEECMQGITEKAQDGFA